MMAMENRMERRKRVLRLRCAVQNYEWARRGAQSAAGRIYALQSLAPLRPDKPYAELWMGTHATGPSAVVLAGQDDAGGMCKAGSGSNCFFGSHDSCDDANGCGNAGGMCKTGSRSNCFCVPHDFCDDANGCGNVCGANAVSEGCFSNGDCNGHELPRRSILLKDWLSENPSVLGNKVLQRWGPDLPFLFKVLSVQKALSIQAHPDKQLAEHLHRLQPDVYKDSNHKPEMAFAVTNFEALCGFANCQEIQEIMEMFPELEHVIGKPLSDALVHQQRPPGKDAKRILKAAFTALMSASKDIVRDTLTQLITRLEKAKAERSLMPKELLVLRLAEQYPGDVGTLSALFLNYILLEPGQALYFDANEPHAYLYGECLECMAASDNVVRAGLTPKYIDTKTLCNMLTYKQGMPEILSGIEVNAYTKRYAPPFDEFEMDSCLLPVGQTSKFPFIGGPSILLVLEGHGTLVVSDEKPLSGIALKSGDTLFIPAGTPYDVSTSQTSKASLRFYRVGVNSRFLLQS